MYSLTGPQKINSNCVTAYHWSAHTIDRKKKYDYVDLQLMKEDDT